MSSRRPLIKKSEWRLFWIVAGIMAALAGGSTALFLVLNKPQEPANSLPTQSPFKKNVADTLQRELVLSDFMLPAPGGEWLSRAWLYSRQSLQKWSLEEIRPFWTPPDQLRTTRLPEENKRLLADFYKGVR